MMMLFLFICLVFALVGILWTFVEFNGDNNEGE